MNIKEFQKINSQALDRIIPKEYEKKASTNKWVKTLSPALRLEFAIRMDRDGWNEVFGSSYTFELRPIYKGKYAYADVKQIRLFELKEYDENLVSMAQEILSEFANKIKEYEGQDSDDYYISLKSEWTPEKTQKYAASSSWFLFYDADDIASWHNAVHKSLLLAIADLEVMFLHKRYDQSNVHTKLVKMKMIVNQESGETTMVED